VTAEAKTNGLAKERSLAGRCGVLRRSDLWAPTERRQYQRRHKWGDEPCLAGRRLGDNRRRAQAWRRSIAGENFVCRPHSYAEETASEHESLGARTPPRRNWRSSGSSNNPTCRFVARWRTSESRDPRSIDGAISIRRVGQKHWTIAALGPIGCGGATASVRARAAC
jgi:hypothetical protein